MNTFGNILKITSFGESHGPAMGVVIDGFPANFKVDITQIQAELNRRKPGQSQITTERNEDEGFEVLSGLFNETTTGAPITLIVRNKNQNSSDYEHLKNIFRPSHADFTYQQKYGIRDYRGGGRQSARETVSRVLAGALAKQFLHTKNIRVTAFVKQVYNISVPEPIESLNLDLIENNIIRCPHTETANKMIALIEEMKKTGDSVGGIITCICKGVPIGLGEPVFGKLHAALASAMLSINATKGFEIGSGFGSIQKKGSELNDEFLLDNNEITTQTNNSGGIQGGISNGQPIVFNVAFKPVATIKKPQQTIDTNLNSVLIEAQGRHDPCVLPRAVPVVEAMANLVLMDFYLLNNKTKK
ncbi:MAG: chorismate synthase [Bacteroidia bacterium]